MSYGCWRHCRENHKSGHSLACAACRKTDSVDHYRHIGDLVREFHESFGLPVSSTYVGRLDQETEDLRDKLLDEELSEYYIARAADDVVSVADAFGDMIYPSGNRSCPRDHEHGWCTIRDSP